jgi:tetratricopeptide (TPR) repeat protein
MSLLELLDLAKQVRGLGDMQGALEVLRRADLRFPAQPEVLTEMALCYEQMGLNDKAAGLWRQLSAQDPNRAGGFRDLAQRRLNAPMAGQPAADSGQILALGACRAQRDAAVANGEKVVLRIPILRQGNSQVDPAQVDIDVYFFDRVNGQQVAQTIADEPSSAWTAPPVDWSGIGEEPLDVTYFLPSLTPGEIAAHGRRAYHGYVVRLYYQNKLQDVAAEPRDLLDFGLPTSRPEAGAAHPLLPPVAR